ncbi:MAG: hypothetical protein E6R03_00070 [Hyphomicrobiaceae bacterium]|nr:MAG: hypothetical protein E6R03_00070 [Hyphomicrobiaceae bacterium]
MKETLWEFLLKLPASFEAQLFYGMMIAGTLGMGMNWLVKWLRNELPCFVTYMFKSEAKRSVLSILTLAGTVLAAIATNVFVIDDRFVGWLNVLWTGATTGFAVDATMNKGSREAWTEEEREKRRA